MSLEQELHSQWAGDATLSSLVPASRLFTGFAAGEPTMPYVVLDGHRHRPNVRASGGSAVDRVEVCFQIYTDDLDEGKQIATAAAQQFDEASFAISDGVVLSMREADYIERLHDDGVWQLSAQYAALIEMT